MARRRSISTRTRSKTKRTETSAPTKRTARFVKATSAASTGTDSRATGRTARVGKAAAPKTRTEKTRTSRQQRPVVQNTRKKATAPRQVLHPEQVTWKDLATDNEARTLAASRASTILGGVSTVRFVAGVLAVLVLVTLYVSHVNATRDVTQEVQALRRERLELQLELNRVSGDYERITGHTQIAGRARDLGLVEAVPEGRPIVVNP